MVIQINTLKVTMAAKIGQTLLGSLGADISKYDYLTRLQLQLEHLARS